MQNGNNENIINARIGRNGDLIASVCSVIRIQLPVTEPIIYVRTRIHKLCKSRTYKSRTPRT